MVVSADDSGIVVFWIVVAGDFVVATVVAGVVEVSTLVFDIPAFAGVLSGDTIVATVVSGVEVFLPVTTGNVLVSAIDSTIVSIVGLIVECAIVISTIPTGVAVTSATFCSVDVVAAVVAGGRVAPAEVTGAVVGLAAVVSHSAVVKCFGFISEVVIGAVVLGKLVPCAVVVSAKDRGMVVFLIAVASVFVVASVVARVVVL